MSLHLMIYLLLYLYTLYTNLHYYLGLLNFKYKNNCSWCFSCVKIWNKEGQQLFIIFYEELRLKSETTF